MTVKRTNCFYSQGLFLSVPALNSVATKMKMTLGLIKKGGGMHSLLFLPSHPSYTLPRMGVSFKKGWTFLHLIWVVSAPSTPFFLKNSQEDRNIAWTFWRCTVLTIRCLLDLDILPTEADTLAPRSCTQSSSEESHVHFCLLLKNILRGEPGWAAHFGNPSQHHCELCMLNSWVLCPHAC